MNSTILTFEINAIAEVLYLPCVLELGMFALQLYNEFYDLALKLVRLCGPQHIYGKLQIYKSVQYIIYEKTKYEVQTSRSILFVYNMLKSPKTCFLLD